MKILTAAELARRTDAELSVLFAELNKALAQAQPCSPAWQALSANLQTIMQVRRQRLYQYRLNLTAS